MLAIARTCKAKGVPWVLDPVAAGFTPLRPAAVRGFFGAGRRA